MNIFYPPKEFSFKYNNWTRVNLFKLIPYPLANIIIFLSFSRKKFYKNFPFVSYFIYSTFLSLTLFTPANLSEDFWKTPGQPGVQPGDLQIPGFVWGFWRKTTVRRRLIEFLLFNLALGRRPSLNSFYYMMLTIYFLRSLKKVSRQHPLILNIS